MRLLHFKKSAIASLGIELEFQIIDPHTYGLISRAKDLIRSVKQSTFQKQIKPEITQSMIEINSSIHISSKEMMEELIKIQTFLLSEADKFNVKICGGGTHPFQKWSVQKIFPTIRYKNLSRQYQYLSKRSTVFGQHIHIGCNNAEDAIYLTHALARYVPQFIAFCASSPFYQGIDTNFHSSRSTIFNAFPLSGVIPYVINWQEFSNYFYKMKNLTVIESMKDFYWDIRPKPEFGTVEIRVCDTPLTLKKATTIAAYIQALSLYLLEEKPHQVCHDLYYLYSYNRFQASRYGFDGEFINPYTFEKCTILQDILETAKKIERYSNQLNSMGYISQFIDNVINKRDDSSTLRQMYKQVGSFQKVVDQQCKLWLDNS